MSALTQTLGRTDFDAPRPWWRRVLAQLLALDALARERHDLAALDDHMLHDIGVTRGEVASALRRPDDHLQLILRRGGHELQH